MVAKLLEYVYCIIRVSIVLLCNWYVPKIQFDLMIFPFVKKKSTFLNCNCGL